MSRSCSRNRSLRKGRFQISSSTVAVATRTVVPVDLDGDDRRWTSFLARLDVLLAPRQRSFHAGHRHSSLDQPANQSRRKL